MRRQAYARTRGQRQAREREDWNQLRARTKNVISVAARPIVRFDVCATRAQFDVHNFSRRIVTDLTRSSCKWSFFRFDVSSVGAGYYAPEFGVLVLCPLQRAFGIETWQHEMHDGNALWLRKWAT
eukprot:721874-Pleurochrysis_carterae.AAC.2